MLCSWECKNYFINFFFQKHDFLLYIQYVNRVFPVSFYTKVVKFLNSDYGYGAMPLPMPAKNEFESRSQPYSLKSRSPKYQLVFRVFKIYSIYRVRS